MSDSNGNVSKEAFGRSLPRRRWVEFATAVGIVLLVVALVIPAIRQAREAARRSTVKNTLKQLGLAFQNYSETYQTLPPGAVIGGDGTPYHGWTSSILPFLDASPVYNGIDFNTPWDSPHNTKHFAGQLKSVYLTPYGTPRWTRDGWPLIHYAANPVLLYRNSSVSLDEVPNQQSVWIIGEVSQQLNPWPYPFNWRSLDRQEKGLSCDFGQSSRNGGAHFLMLDGSVRFVYPPSDCGHFSALSERASMEIRAKRGEPTREQSVRPERRQFETTQEPPPVAYERITRTFLEQGSDW